MLCTLAYFSSPSVGSSGVGIPAWDWEPTERAPVWESIHVASWPANRLARLGGDDFFPKLVTHIKGISLATAAVFALAAIPTTVIMLKQTYDLWKA